ncbi:hypothetical protein L228DRAFT_251335 [Xylona heveae TC161]|uniref:Uncharacterized protein n=1 Tax=Xylona heveae (strain CBS 132557 / TC161) TaxID=1328760 RepID=A0A164ZKW0_XYLHT|nr:hypothetical protein L228DRAFT_251335 [Xylona heveae TC161]KZF19223.1 hypothetical protein L228DRAFT_251335 [Xylona heveae TC161]
MELTWLNWLNCVRWLNSDVEVITDVIRQASIYQAPSTSYLDGQQVIDGSFVFGIHTACYTILAMVLKRVGLNCISPIFCELLHTIPFSKWFEADSAALHIEFDGRRIHYLPEKIDPKSTDETDFIFADPVAISWEDIERCTTIYPETSGPIVTMFRDLESDIFSKVPEEIICSIFDNLPTKDVRNLRSLSAAAARTRLPTRFWSTRLREDLPYVKLLKGQSNLGYEAQYKLVKKTLRNGIGNTAKSLRNLRRIAKQADQLCTIIRLRAPMAPGKGTSFIDFCFEPETGPINFSMLSVGHTRYISGIRVSDGSDGCGWNYQGSLQRLPVHLISPPMELVLSNTEGGYVGIGFTDASGKETFIGQRSGLNIGIGKCCIKSGDILRFDFDTFKLVSVKLGPPGSLRTPLTWMPQLPPTCTPISLSEPHSSLRGEESYHVCHFGGPNGCHLETLIQINAFFVGPGLSITGMEFIYTKEQVQQWGTCYGTRQCKIIDGPGGERVLGIGVTSTQIGIEQIRLRTNGHQELVFKCPESDYALPAIRYKGLITGVYGLFRSLNDRFIGVKFLKEMGILTESGPIPSFVSKNLTPSELEVAIPTDMLSTVKINSWGAFISSASLDGIETVEVAINRHKRLTGMKLTYGNCQSSAILADFPSRNGYTETVCFSAFESIMQMTCHYQVMQGQPFCRKILKSLHIRTNQRDITLGQTHCACAGTAAHSQTHIVDGKHCQPNQARILGSTYSSSMHKRKFDEILTDLLPTTKSKIIWIYNAEYDEVFHTIHTAHTV